jgi:hypothetical protein
MSQESPLLIALEYIRDNIEKAFPCPDIITKNEIKRIMDSQDKYLINSLQHIIEFQSKTYALHYWRRHHKYTETEDTFDTDDFARKSLERFWQYFTD